MIKNIIYNKIDILNNKNIYNIKINKINMKY